MSKLNYMLGRELIKIITHNRDFFLQTIAPNPKNLEYFISTDAPKMVANAFDLPQQIVPIKSITGDIKKATDKNLLIVEFADEFVQDDLDNIALIIVTGDSPNVRVFTYEKGRSVTGDPIAFVGEFTPEDEHKNYGSTREVNIRDFFERVVSILVAK